MRLLGVAHLSLSNEVACKIVGARQAEATVVLADPPYALVPQWRFNSIVTLAACVHTTLEV